MHFDRDFLNCPKYREEGDYLHRCTPMDLACYAMNDAEDTWEIFEAAVIVARLLGAGADPNYSMVGGGAKERLEQSWESLGDLVALTVLQASAEGSSDTRLEAARSWVDQNDDAAAPSSMTGC